MTAGPVTITPLRGIPEVVAGDDLADLVDLGLTASGLTLQDGDVLVLSSKVASKALGLVVDEGSSAEKTAVIAAETVRVVAERLADGRVTRVVESVAGPVMAAAGVDASNTGSRGGWLVLPADPDDVCRRLHAELTRRHGVRLGVLLSDTAGRPWRVGQVDFALGAHGLAVLEDLRGARDLDGRDLSVTMRALADEVASAADLVKGKALGVPAAVVRGVDGLVPDRPPTTTCGRPAPVTSSAPGPRTGSATAGSRPCGPPSGSSPAPPSPSRSASPRCCPRRAPSGSPARCGWRSSATRRPRPTWARRR